MDEHLQGQPQQPRGGVSRIGLKGRKIGRRLGVEIRFARIDQMLEVASAQPVRGDRRPQGLDDGMRRYASAINRLDSVTPPLEPDQPDRRLADDIRRLRNLQIKRVQSKQRRARRCWREQASEIAFMILAAQHFGAIGRRLGTTRRAHAWARSAWQISGQGLDSGPTNRLPQGPARLGKPSNIRKKIMG